MRQAYACYAFSDIEIKGLHHYIQCMMMTIPVFRKLYRFLIGPLPLRKSYALSA